MYSSEIPFAELMKEDCVLQSGSEEQLTKNQKRKLRKKLGKRHKVNRIFM